MAVVNIPVVLAPFQGQPNPSLGDPTGVGVDILDIAQVATQEMSFINSGYTVLYVIMGAGPIAPVGDLIVSSIRDVAGRVADIGPIAPGDFNDVSSYGPFRPIWWNFGGRVNLSFDVEPVNQLVAAVQYQF